jgi:hypothetical protein
MNRSAQVTTPVVETPRLTGEVTPRLLLERIISLVDEEPKRLDMRYWLAAYRGLTDIEAPLDASVIIYLPHQANGGSL